MDALAELRPSWRGLLHRGAAPVFGLAFAFLTVRTPAAQSNRLAVTVYGLGVLAMFSVSAAYHASAARPSQLSRVLQRLDHGAILLAIAGTYTAVTALALVAPRRGQLLVGVWVLAAVGITVQVLLVSAPRWVGAVGYLAVGWFAVFDLPAYLRGTTAAEFTWIVLGGVVYSAGGIVYALKRPNPAPATFGYHEVFHALTVVAAACHFVAVALLVSRL
ncbi:MAG TPA: hemolysin III family protein [Acidimicrobiales bacterium]|nr:hemolysin III family protein [Acidimicrobiales bacterium]